LAYDYCNWDWVKITCKLKNTLKFSPKSSGNTFPLKPEKTTLPFGLLNISLGKVNYNYHKLEKLVKYIIKSK